MTVKNKPAIVLADEPTGESGYGVGLHFPTSELLGNMTAADQPAMKTIFNVDDKYVPSCGRCTLCNTGAYRYPELH